MSYSRDVYGAQVPMVLQLLRRDRCGGEVVGRLDQRGLGVPRGWQAQPLSHQAYSFCHWAEGYLDGEDTAAVALGCGSSTRQGGERSGCDWVRLGAWMDYAREMHAHVGARD